MPLLGPLLFLIIKKYVLKCTKLNMVNCADESAVYVVADSLESMLGSLNLKLGETKSWLCVNKLSLNFGEYLFIIW